MIWIVLCGLCLVAFLYPYIGYPLALRGLSREPYPAPEGAANDESYALLFCAYNEAASLPRTLNNLAEVKAAWPELSIMAYNDCSADETGALLNEASDILVAVHGEQRAGKPTGMKRLVEASDADNLIFMDANVLIDPTHLLNVKRYFADPSIGTVAGKLIYTNEGDSEVATVGGLYWRLEENLKRQESETGSAMGADGSLFAMRARYYPTIRPDLQDDFLASMAPVFEGLRCVSAPDVIAYEEATVGSSDEFRRKRRIACGAYSSHRSIAAEVTGLSARNRFKYVSHKLLRWFGLHFIVLGTIFAMAAAWQFDLLIPFVVALLIAAAAFAIAVFLRLSPAVKVLEILLAIVATGVGVTESMIGRKYATWAPSQR